MCGYFHGNFQLNKKSLLLGVNTGHSAGPHLHLEIRDTKTESPMNGLLFFNQIPETEKPILKQLALYNGTTSIYEQSPKLIPITQ